MDKIVLSYNEINRLCTINMLQNIHKEPIKIEQDNSNGIGCITKIYLNNKSFDITDIDTW